MSKRFIRILSICMAMLTLLSAVPAQAAFTLTESTVYITANTLNAYQKMDTTSKVLGVMTYGENMTMLDFDGEWVKIRNAKGQTGYCQLSGLSSQNPNTLSQTVYAKTNRTPVYHKASTSYKKIAHVKQNAALNIVAKTPDGKWLRAKNGSIYGYVLASDVSSAPVSTHNALIASTVYVVSENAAVVYSNKGYGKQMGTISHGQSYTLLANEGKYSRIRNGYGHVGYCPSDVLSAANPNKLNQTMYAQVGGSILYPNTLLKDGTAKYIAKNTRLTVVAESPSGGWYRVKYGSKHYYVPSILLDSRKAVSGGLELQCRSNANLYARPSVSAAVVGRVAAGDSVILKGVSGIGALIATFDGKTGYLPFGSLRKYTWTFAA